ncbi:MAG: YjbQ family protein [Candidatus Aenigmarchaeota archaeon]|nr:YjbQ family protein [Candidatus Aenigmarchaeota archaeon]
MIVTKSIRVESRADLDIIDITEKVQEIVSSSKIKEGTVTVFVKGSTASVSTIEYEPNLVKDVKEAFERIAPSGREYEHHKTWGDRNGKSHVRATLMGPSCTIPFQDGKLILGQWQNLVLLDFDVPVRERELVLTVSGE